MLCRVCDESQVPNSGVLPVWPLLSISILVSVNFNLYFNRSLCQYKSKILSWTLESFS